jgi:hypothetical protein
MEINGLPLHPLVIHAAVVFAPIAALVALLYAAVPTWRDRLRWPMVVLALVAGGAVVAAYVTGRSFLNSRPELGQLAQVQTHQHRAWIALWCAVAFTVAAVVAGWLHPRPGIARLVTSLALGVTAVALLIAVVLAGDAGARAVWGA